MDSKKIASFQYESFMECIDDLELLVNNIKNNKDIVKKYIESCIEKEGIDKFLLLKNLIEIEKKGVEDIYLMTKDYYFITDNEIKAKSKEFANQENIMKNVKKILPFIMLLSS